MHFTIGRPKLSIGRPIYKGQIYIKNTAGTLPRFTSKKTVGKSWPMLNFGRPIVKCTLKIKKTLGVSSAQKLRASTLDIYCHLEIFIQENCSNHHTVTSVLSLTSFSVCHPHSASLWCLGRRAYRPLARTHGTHPSHPPNPQIP